MKKSWGLIFILFCFTAQAKEVIKFPDEELATETVLPVFDKAPVVKNRNVVTAKRFEIGGGMGLNMTEALYNSLNFFASGTYHFDENHGINISGLFIMDGLSDKGEALQRGEGTNGQEFDASLAPQAELILITDYQFNAFYGKISITKNTVMNLSLYFLAGLEFVSFGDSTNFGLNLGFGQKLYLSKDLALRVDLRFLSYLGPDPTSDPNDLNPVVDNSQRSSSDLDETTFFHTFLNVGLVFLL